MPSPSVALGLPLVLMVLVTSVRVDVHESANPRGFTLCQMTTMPYMMVEACIGNEGSSARRYLSAAASPNCDRPPRLQVSDLDPDHVVAGQQLIDHAMLAHLLEPLIRNLAIEDRAGPHLVHSLAG